MPRKRSIIPAAAMTEILRRAGAERVSDKASMAMAEVMIEKAFELSKDAVRFCKHAGRKTIKKEDIDLARRGI